MVAAGAHDAGGRAACHQRNQQQRGTEQVRRLRRNAGSAATGSMTTPVADGAGSSKQRRMELATGSCRRRGAGCRHGRAVPPEDGERRL